MTVRPRREAARRPEEESARPEDASIATSAPEGKDFETSGADGRAGGEDCQRLRRSARYARGHRRRLPKATGQKRLSASSSKVEVIDGAMRWTASAGLFSSEKSTASVTLMESGRGLREVRLRGLNIGGRGGDNGCGGSAGGPAAAAAVVRRRRARRRSKSDDPGRARRAALRKRHYSCSRGFS